MICMVQFALKAQERDREDAGLDTRMGGRVITLKYRK